MSAHLTVPNPELAEQIARTPHSMAHWTGTGPDGAKCGACKHYGYTYTGPDGELHRRHSSCALYYKRIGSHGNGLKKTQVGCKYFEKAPA